MRYGDFAQQCYDSFENTHSSQYYGNSKRSKSSLSQRMGSLQYGVGYEVTKYIYANTNVLDSLFGGSEKYDTGAWMGYIAVCTDANEMQRLGRRDVVVAWRGTQTPHEWIQNLRDILVPTTWSKSTACPNIQAVSRPDVRVEKGFLSCYTAVDEDSVRCRTSARDIVVAEINRLLDEYAHKDDYDLSITFTGHSLGGALATLSAYDIKQICINRNMPDVAVTVFAWASPRVGNLSFAQHMEEIGVKVLRVVNEDDVVPKVPGVFVNESLPAWVVRTLQWLPWAYVHVGAEITLSTRTSALLKSTSDPAEVHNLEVYLHLMDGYQGKNKPFKASGLRDAALVNKRSDLLIDRLQIPSNWWPRRNKELVKRIDGVWVFSPKTPNPTQ